MDRGFTPGPWRVGSWSGQCHKIHGDGRSGHPGPGGVDGCVYDHTFRPSEPGDCYVAGIAGPEPQQMVVEVSCDSLSMRRNDARLIAAAPDMYAVLDELEGTFDEQTYLEKMREDFDAPDDREYSVNITAKQLRAISKILNGLQSTSGEKHV